MTLTEHDHETISRARQLATLNGLDGIRSHTGEHDVIVAYVAAFAQAQHLLAELAAIAERTATAEA